MMVTPQNHCVRGEKNNDHTHIMLTTPLFTMNMTLTGAVSLLILWSHGFLAVIISTSTHMELHMSEAK